MSLTKLFNKNYFYALSKYNKILLQRNKLLKSYNNDTIKETLSIWNEQLAEAGATIVKFRLDFINLLDILQENIGTYNRNSSTFRFLWKFPSNLKKSKKI